MKQSEVMKQNELFFEETGVLPNSTADRIQEDPTDYS